MHLCGQFFLHAPHPIQASGTSHTADLIILSFSLNRSAYSYLSAAPHAVPQAALVCALSCLFHPKRFANAIFITSCNIKIGGFALLQDHHNKTANL